MAHQITKGQNETEDDNRIVKINLIIDTKNRKIVDISSK